jgi:hypothetical protein
VIAELTQEIQFRPGEIWEAHLVDRRIGAVYKIDPRDAERWSYAFGTGATKRIRRFIEGALTSGRACVVVVHQDGAYLVRIEVAS